MLVMALSSDFKLISTAFEHCVLRGFLRKLCSANMTLTQSTCMVFKHLLHPQKVLAALGHAYNTLYAMFKRKTEIDCR